jgi:alpha-beta hydrolase superfamily lysophospholipase
MIRRRRNRRWAVILVAVGLQAVCSSAARAQATEPFAIRGRTLSLRVLGPSTGDPVIVASGDGGWIRLGPDVADTLARVGYRVVGLDSREYLSTFTRGSTRLSEADVPRDFSALVAFAARGHVQKPILIGVSEGAGLCVLAAADPGTRSAIRGVVVLGLPDVNELGWRWQDALIYLTKGVPDEPTFSVARIIDRLAPLPLAAIHSTHDEFAPVPAVNRLMDRARDPKRLWIIPASNHRFSGSEEEFRRRLLEAVAWVKAAGR